MLINQNIIFEILKIYSMDNTKIKGLICGYRVEEIDDKLVQ
ncbi:MAG TPA: hypothetical protein DEO54_04440 [Rikenellaceae bacterium]|nr:hypothetical protein [Rikenellaceae bacterium]